MEGGSRGRLSVQRPWRAPGKCLSNLHLSVCPVLQPQHTWVGRMCLNSCCAVSFFYLWFKKRERERVWNLFLPRHEWSCLLIPERGRQKEGKLQFTWDLYSEFQLGVHNGSCLRNTNKRILFVVTQFSSILANESLLWIFPKTYLSRNFTIKSVLVQYLVTNVRTEVWRIYL